MRPPVLPSGNKTPCSIAYRFPLLGFNEAAGFTQRKHVLAPQELGAHVLASMRPPVLPSGNEKKIQSLLHRPRNASMRPPVLPSGNPVRAVAAVTHLWPASMRPPVLPSGNHGHGRHRQRPDAVRASMRPPVLPSGNAGATAGLEGVESMLQ